MNHYRQTLLASFQTQLIERNLRLEELEGLLPLYKQQKENAAAQREHLRLAALRDSLAQEVSELKLMIADLKTEMKAAKIV